MRAPLAESGASGDMPSVRAGDDPAGEPWKRRRIAMHADGPPMAINGWMARARFISLLLKDLSGGGVAILLLGLVVAWLFGFVGLPVVDNVFNKILADDTIMMNQLTRIEERQNRLITIFVTATKVNCENTWANNSTARTNCLNIHE